MVQTLSDHRATLLLVDDEAEILVALADLLEDEFRVLTAHSGAEALAMLPGEPQVEVIISDQRMPGMTGDAFLAQAREVCAAEALLLTGYADLEAVISAVNRGRIAGYAPKPWEPMALLSMVRSAVQRFRLARALDMERALLRGLMDSTSDVVFFKDLEGRFTRMNAAKAALLGGTPEALMGHVEALSAEEQAAVDEGRQVEQVEQRSHAGGLHWLRVVRIPIRDAGGRITHLATLEHDITEQRQMQERLHQAEKMQALGTMAGGVAHDFNNLLTAILGSLELLAASDLPHPRQSRMISNAVAAAERGSALTKRLLSFSRKRQLQPRPSDVNRLVTEMEDLLLRSLGDHVVLHQQLDPGLHAAMADPEQLGLALLNLCINSRDAMPEGGRITLTTRNLTLAQDELPDLPAGDYVAVAVADTGTGMPPEVVSQAFEPFFTTKEVGRGTGLGLSMVYGLTRQSGGTTIIRSREGEGTTVEMLLPRALAPAEATPPMREPARQPARPLQILVVDDDADVRGITVTILGELGHQSLAAPDAQSALALLEAQPGIDLMITDVMMPGMDGRKLADHARMRRPGLPILLLSGYADAGGLPANYPLLRKPFRRGELAEQIALLLPAR
ncbi:response regulator [Teichococcus oryzae]|uniref:histidine kinase n=1 Tax=Teichococcus oryzae TaxID=1608942 RepID=A0A5B2TC45_9PROT|nr:response regulator [Pseudoroseomonas oryzae]KAA2212076.1 response regulator [Pseudoroseomonas oryzae]